MAVHPCPRCKSLIPVGVQYCDACRPIAEAQAREAIERKQAYKRAKYNRAYNQKRDPKYGQFYRTKEWRLLSRTKLQDCGYKCEAHLDGCKGLAVEVHHINPIKTDEGWEARLEWNNLMGVCISCHNILDGKTFKRKAEPGVIDLRTVETTKTQGVGQIV